MAARRTDRDRPARGGLGLETRTAARTGHRGDGQVCQCRKSLLCSHGGLGRRESGKSVDRKAFSLILGSATPVSSPVIPCVFVTRIADSIEVKRSQTRGYAAVAIPSGGLQLLDGISNIKGIAFPSHRKSERSSSMAALPTTNSEILCC